MNNILNEWSHLCWPDNDIQWNLTELQNIYQTIFSKYERYHQQLRNTNMYRGIAFQGIDNNDHTSSVKHGIIFTDPVDNVLKPIPPEQLGKHLDYTKTLCVRHKELCIGEFNNILDYLEVKGWHTYRARIMELGPGMKGKWHIDSYPNMWGNNLRYHIPLYTNSGSYIQWNEKDLPWHSVPIKNDDDKSFHLPANGSGYWFNTDVNHRYFNEGTEWRVHIVIDLIKK